MKNCAVIGSLLLAVAVLFAPRAKGVQAEESGAARLIPIWPLESFFLSPDGDSLLSWRSGQARLLDRETHAVRLHVELGDGETFSPSFFGARFAQDGTRAVLWTRAGDLTLMQLDPPRVLWKEDPSDWRTYHAVRFDAQLRRAVKHKGRTLQVLDLLEAGPVDALPPISVVSGDPAAFRAVSLSEDGERVLVETKRGIKCVELDAPEGTRTGPPVDLHRADSVQLFGDEERAIVLVREGAFLVDLRSGRVLVRRALPLARWQTRYTSTLAPVLPIWDWHAGLRVLDVETLEVLWELEACELATYDPASHVVVVIHDFGGPVTVHDAGSGERLWGLEGRALDIAPAGLRRRAIVFDGAGKFLASSYDNSVRYSFDCRTGVREELPMVLHGTAAHAGPLTADALWVADCGGELRSLSAEDGSELASVALGEPLASVESIDGVLVAASQSGRTRIWRGPELEAVTEFDGGPEFALAPGADRVISCGGD